jgi:pimeloyl-ACP methyl ester carboxylesterase
VHALLQHLGIKKVYLVGNSLGGWWNMSC